MIIRVAFSCDLFPVIVLEAKPQNRKVLFLLPSRFSCCSECWNLFDNPDLTHTCLGRRTNQQLHLRSHPANRLFTHLKTTIGG